MQKTRKYQIRSYDVWGNENDGWVVNNTFDDGIEEIVCDERIANEGTSFQFSYWCPTDSQIAGVFGYRADQVSISGDDAIHYVDTDTGYPIGDLTLIGDEDEDD